MTPIHPSPAYHGYQYSDGGALNPRFGNEDDFRRFVYTAHSMGIRVFIDLVAYGVGTQSPFFSGPYNNPGNSYSNMFQWYNAGQTNWEGFTYPTWNGNSVGFAWWNMNDPRPAQVELAWVKKWLNPNYGFYTNAGVDGFRVDHAVDSFDPYGPNGLGYTISNFWNPFITAVHAEYPDAVFFVEQGDWSLFGNTFLPPFDGAFTKPLEFATRDGLTNENPSGIVTAINNTRNSLSGLSGSYLTTMGDHDVTRLISSVGGSIPKAKLAAGIQMSLPYSPCIYYGDELGMKGFQSQAYNSDANDIPVREPFKWKANAAWPMSNYYAVNSAVYAARYSRNLDGISVEEEQVRSDSLLSTYKRLIASRKRLSPLHSGTFGWITASDNKILAYVRHDGNKSVIPVFNLSGATKSFTLNLSPLGPQSNNAVTDDLDSSASLALATSSNYQAYPITLAPYQMRYLVIADQNLP